jgi:hypothetical protein
MVIVASSWGDLFPRGRQHESVQQRTKLKQPIHGQPRIRYDANRGRFWSRHPGGKEKRRTIRLADDQMARASVLSVANNQHHLAGERMKRIGNYSLKRQTSGIMSSPRMAAASIGRSSPRSSKLAR